MKLKVLTYNTLFAGRDGKSDARAKMQVALIHELRPDVLLMQEAKGFDANGSEWLFALEGATGMRGFLAVAPRTGQNLAIFIRSPLQPLAFDVDGSNFHHALATLKVGVPGFARPLTFISTHFCPNGAGIRGKEAAYLAVQAAPDRLTLVAGDFNSASPHDPDPIDWPTLAAHHRARYIAEDLRSLDRSVLARLEDAGWVDLGNRLDAERTPTVPTRAYRDAEFATMRCDYMLATKSLAACASSYRVIRNDLTDVASDHYPVVAEFELTS